MNIECTQRDYLYEGNSAIDKGFYRLYYSCYKCNTQLGRATYDKNHKLVNIKTILKDDTIPRYCPCCGERTSQYDKYK